MSAIYLLELASQQTQWLSARQRLIAGNIANANTPGYTSMDIQPFSRRARQDPHRHGLDQQRAHAAYQKILARPTARSGAAENPWETTYSGNSVSLEQEMMKEGDINRSYTLPTPTSSGRFIKC